MKQFCISTLILFTCLAAYSQKPQLEQNQKMVQRLSYLTLANSGDKFPIKRNEFIIMEIHVDSLGKIKTLDFYKKETSIVESRLAVLKEKIMTNWIPVKTNMEFRVLAPLWITFEETMVSGLQPFSIKQNEEYGIYVFKENLILMANPRR